MLVGLGIAQPILAATQAQIWMGWIVASKSSPNALWYVWPRTKERMAASTLEDIRTILRTKALKIKYQDLIRIPLAGTTTEGDVAFRRRLAGQFVVVTDRRSQAWYIHPRYKRRYLLGQGQAAVDFLRSQRVLLGDSDLASILVAPDILKGTRTVVSNRGSYLVDYVSFDRTSPGLRLTVDTASSRDCANNCPALALKEYVVRQAALVGIHGAYACPPDYAACAGQVNFYYAPIFNSYKRVMINAGRIKFTAEPLVAVDTTNRLFFYREARQFTSYQDFLNEFRADSLAAGGTGVLQAAISNHPALIIAKKNVVNPARLDRKQATVKSYRGVLAWKGDTVYLLVVRGATVPDTAAVMMAMGMDYALNLDGGGSTALYYDNRYALGPGRYLTNVLLIDRR